MRQQWGPRCLRLQEVSLLIGAILISTATAKGQHEPLSPLASAADRWSASCPLTFSLNQSSGVSVDPVYYGEVFTNTRGGISTSGATQYQALFDLPITIDLERTSVPLPGRFFLLAQNTHGRGLTNEFVGDTLVVSNIDSSDNITQMSEFWWELPLCDGDVAVRLGKQDINTEFLLMETAADFVQSSFGLSPSAALPSFPNTSMAVVGLVQLTDAVQLKTGIWDALGDGGTWGFSGNSVSISIVELQHNHEIAWGDSSLPGTVEAGYIYFSGGDAFGLSLPSAYGVYLQVQQLVYRESTPDGQIQGLGLFASYHPRFGEDPEINIGIVDDVVAGVTYTGLLPGRDHDVIGLGYVWAQINQVGPNTETVFEAFYKAQLTPHVSLQPDLQYVGSPSGIHPDALVVGVRFALAF